MWPSGDCIDRFLAVGVNRLARLRLTTRGNTVLRLIVASLIHWLSSRRRHSLACCYALWIRHLFSDCLTRVVPAYIHHVLCSRGMPSS